MKMREWSESFYCQSLYNDLEYVMYSPLRVIIVIGYGPTEHNFSISLDSFQTNI